MYISKCVPKKYRRLLVIFSAWIFNWFDWASMLLVSLVFPIEKKIVFKSFDGRQYSDNPRAISDKMHELYPQYKIVWYFSRNDMYQDIPNYVKIINSRKELIYESATTFCYISNTQFENDVYKRKGQFFIQTWHGDRVPKKVLYNIGGYSQPIVPVMDGKVTDLAIAASEIGEKVYRSAFRYNGEILRVGMPRNDCLVNIDEHRVNSIKKRLMLGLDTKLVIFAPTFRDNQAGKQKISIEIKSILHTLCKKTEEKWVCLIRGHIGKKLEYEACEDIVDVTQYSDMADLLLIADILITDYSSSAGDFILKNKATILAMFDVEDYTTNCRELAFNPELEGFIVAHNQKELERILESYSADDYYMNCQYLMKRFSVVETGKASETICQIINTRYFEYNNNK